MPLHSDEFHNMSCIMNPSCGLSLQGTDNNILSVAWNERRADRNCILTIIQNHQSHQSISLFLNAKSMHVWLSAADNVSTITSTQCTELRININDGYNNLATHQHVKKVLIQFICGCLVQQCFSKCRFITTRTNIHCTCHCHSVHFSTVLASLTCMYTVAINSVWTCLSSVNSSLVSHSSFLTMTLRADCMNAIQISTQLSTLNFLSPLKSPLKLFSL